MPIYVEKPGAMDRMAINMAQPLAAPFTWLSWWIAYAVLATLLIFIVIWIFSSCRRARMRMKVQAAKAESEIARIHKGQ